MNGVVLVDTNAVSDLLKGDREILRILNQFSEIATPTPVLGELYFEMENSARRDKNIENLETAFQAWKVIRPDIDTAKRYGQIRVALKCKGRPIQEPDMWIAAIALQHSLPLATRDSDFDNVDGLTVVRWTPQK